ncbi:LysR substrate-binding domain-containing protein [Morganella morganii]|nr:LysR substrate-binding domain-containing protein [Morganella morganii]
MHQAVLQGTGICQLPQFIAAPDIRAGRLIPLLPEYLLPRHHIYAVYPDIFTFFAGYAGYGRALSERI